jgi:hypothetical protein
LGSLSELQTLKLAANQLSGDIGEVLYIKPEKFGESWVSLSHSPNFLTHKCMRKNTFCFLLWVSLSLSLSCQREIFFKNKSITSFSFSFD